MRQFSILRGFTLIELLVVISIMALLSVVSFAKFTTLKEEQNLKSAANELQSLIKVAQTNAISRVKCGSSSTSTSGVTWLVEFRTDQKTIDLKCFTDPADVKLQKTVTLTSTQPQIDSINGQDTCTSSYPNYVISASFAPLFGTITFTDKSPTALPCFATSNQISVVLAKSGTSAKKFVIVQRGGVVSIADSIPSQPPPPPPSSTPTPSATPTPTPTPGPVDSDGDSYQAGVSSTTCPNGKKCDCYDNNAAAHPCDNSGLNCQTGYFSTTRGTSVQGNDSAGNIWNSYDYDCSGNADKDPQYNCITTMTNGGCTAISGTVGYLSSIPSCGQSATFRQCLAGNICGTYTTTSATCGLGCPSLAYQSSFDTSQTIGCR